MPNTAQTKGVNVPKSKNKPRSNKRTRNRRRNKQKMLNGSQQQHKTQTQIPFSQSAHQNGVDVWREAYKNAVRWHGEHQSNFWRHAAQHLETENLKLRQQLSCVANKQPETSLNYETSDEEDDQNDISVKKEDPDEGIGEVDSNYLEFLQTTNKHREELRLKREAEALEEEEDSSRNTEDLKPNKHREELQLKREAEALEEEKEADSSKSTENLN